MEEEEEGQPSLQQTATSVAAGEEEEGELGEGTTNQPSTSASTSQTKEEGGEREKCGVIELVGGVYTIPLQSHSLLFLLPPSPLSPTSYSPCEEEATTNLSGMNHLVSSAV